MCKSPKYSQIERENLELFTFPRLICGMKVLTFDLVNRYDQNSTL